MKNSIIVDNSIDGMSFYSFEWKNDKDTKCNIKSIPNLPGVYLFVDNSNNVYIGQTGDMQGRIYEHRKSRKKKNSVDRFVKEEASRVYIFCGEDLMEGLVKWLEAKMIDIVSNIGYYNLKNDTSSKFPYIPEKAKEWTETSLENIKKYMKANDLKYIL